MMNFVCILCGSTPGQIQYGGFKRALAKKSGDMIRDRVRILYLAKGQTKLFQFLLLDNNFPTPSITLAKSTLHQTLPQSLENPIPIINYQFWKHSKINRGANLANCVRIKIDGSQKDPSKEFVPNIILTNVMSLVPKMDELEHAIREYSADIAFITESWLKNSVPDEVIEIGGYRVFRRDRTEKGHGGVCIYTKSCYVANVISDIPNEDGCEVLWVKVNPRRLPRGFSALVLGVLYHPPSTNKTTMLQYLQSSLELLEIKYPNCGLILAGDFNKLPIRHLSSQFQLEQMVNFNTRGSSKLDLILTNLSDFYDQPLSSPPLRLSDHLTIVALAKQRICSNQSKN